MRNLIYLGGSFAANNPALVNIAWNILQNTWDPIIEKIVPTNPVSDSQDMAKLVIMEVVLAQISLQNPIFLIIKGCLGYAFFLVDPNSHSGAEALTSDELFFYEELCSRLRGRIPNAVFKLPGTLAGLETCSSLTFW